MSFSERLKVARNRMEITQQQLADAVGIAKSTIAGYETSNRTPEYDTLKKIANVLEVPCTFLLEDGIFSKIDWIDENYTEIMNVINQEFGNIFHDAYEKTKDFIADEKALLLSSIVDDIKLDDSSSVTEAKIYFCYESRSYDDIFDLKLIYKDKFGAKIIDDEQNILYLHDFTDKEKEQIRNFALFIQQNRDK